MNFHIINDDKQRLPEHKDNALTLTLGHLEGNLTHCSLCGETVKQGENYFDYDYGGHAEITHNDCVGKEMARIKEEGLNE